MEAREALRRTISALAGDPPSSIEDFSTLFAPREFAPGELFVPGGSRPGSVGFVARGLMRMFYARDDGREFNKSFVAENEFCAALEALLDGEPSRLAIEALEPSLLLVADFSRYRALLQVDPYWERLARIVAERLYVKKARREAALLVDPPATRYETFRREHPGLEGRIRDYHIASYVGVTPESLSRLKRARTGGDGLR